MFKNVLFMLAISLASSAFAEPQVFRYCRINGGNQDLDTLITVYHIGEDHNPRFWDVHLISIQTYEQIGFKEFKPNSEKFEYSMSLEKNFNKGAVYSIDLRQPNGNPGVLFMDFGSGTFSIALYTTPLSSISGSLECAIKNPFEI